MFLLMGSVVYVRFKYPIFKYKFNSDFNSYKSIILFSGWTLLGSSANVSTQQGVSLLLNHFVGLVANAALGFTNQVNAAVNHFVGSFATAFTPQIVKQYAQNETNSLFLLIHRASKFSFILVYVIALPLIINMNYVLNL